MSDLFVSEQFIQDAAAPRLGHLVHKVLCLPWEPQDGVPTEEFSFSRGRIDILATFGAKRRLLFVEVKRGCAGSDAVRQLAGYLENASDIAAAIGCPPVPTATAEPAFTPHGVIISHSFDSSAREAALNRGISLVTFSLAPGKFPFRLATEFDERDPHDQDRGPPSSGLVTVEDHANWIEHDELQAAFHRLSKGALRDPSAGAERAHWIYANAKNDHVWVRYKGERVLCLWARRDHFEVGYFDEGSWRNQKVHRHDAGALLPAIEEAVSNRLDSIDAKLGNLNLFRWSDVLL